MKTLYRIGQIVPSSNITMETEIPAMLQARQLIRPERFAFHSSRMRMNEVSKDELAAMDDQSDRCALELSGRIENSLASLFDLSCHSVCQSYGAIGVEHYEVPPDVDASVHLHPSATGIGPWSRGTLTPYVMPISNETS